MTKAQGSFEVSSWDEDPYEHLEGGGGVQWLMAYRADETAHFVGLQLVDGAVHGREGSLVLDSVGEFDGQVARGTWTVVEGSGTGELAGVRGSGSFEAPLGGTPTYQLDYEVG